MTEKWRYNTRGSLQKDIINAWESSCVWVRACFMHTKLCKRGHWLAAGWHVMCQRWQTLWRNPLLCVLTAEKVTADLQDRGLSKTPSPSVPPQSRTDWSRNWFCLFIWPFCYMLKAYQIFTFTFTFMHLADAFIQSDLQCSAFKLQILHYISFKYSKYVSCTHTCWF